VNPSRERESTAQLSYSTEEIEACVSLLKYFTENSEEFAALSQEQRVALLSAAGQLSRPSKEDLIRRNKLIQKQNREKKRRVERSARSSTGIREARKASVFSAPMKIEDSAGTQRPELNSPRNCYVCKAEFTQLHFFYDAMCPSCAEFNYQKRFQTASLHGQVALITGSRLKIGYQATLMMLRSGARVIATTRFPVDSALRYAQEKDFTNLRS
jgi:hypothetical protein